MPDSSLFIALVARFGYPAVAAGCFVKAFSVLVAAGALAQQGYLAPFPLLLWAWLGTLAGDEAEFNLGRRYGPPLVQRLPRRGRAVRRLLHILALVRRHDALVVLGFRFIYGIRLATPLVLGMEGMGHRRFFILNAAGSLLWCAICLLGGYGLGGVLSRWYGSLMAHPVPVAVGTLVVLLALVLALLRLRRGFGP